MFCQFVIKLNHCVPPRPVHPRYHYRNGCTCAGSQLGLTCDFFLPSTSAWRFRPQDERMGKKVGRAGKMQNMICLCADLMFRYGRGKADREDFHFPAVLWVPG